MDINVPYMPSIKNLVKILDAVQHAAVPEAFGHDFLKDLGFTSSNDRSVIKVFKYLGFLDASGRTQSCYREFVDHNRTKLVLADRLKISFDDLYISHKTAHDKSVDELKGWFKSKTGKGDAVALKIATTFKNLAGYADFTISKSPLESKEVEKPKKVAEELPLQSKAKALTETKLGLVYRLEIHLPDTQNINTFRAIFKAMKEELGL